jgi:hypothetical protein
MYKPKTGLMVSLILSLSLLVIPTTQAQLPSPLPDGTRLTIGPGSFFEVPGFSMPIEVEPGSRTGVKKF